MRSRRVRRATGIEVRLGRKQSDVTRRKRSKARAHDRVQQLHERQLIVGGSERVERERLRRDLFEVRPGVREIERG